MDEWNQITEDLWQKEVVTQIGIVLAEVFKFRRFGAYISRVKVIKAFDNRYLRATRESNILLPLREAQAKSEKLLEELITSGPIPTPTIESRPINDYDDGTRR